MTLAHCTTSHTKKRRVKPIALELRSASTPPKQRGCYEPGNDVTGPRRGILCSRRRVDLTRPSASVHGIHGTSQGPSQGPRARVCHFNREDWLSGTVHTGIRTLQDPEPLPGLCWGLYPSVTPAGKPSPNTPSERRTPRPHPHLPVPALSSHPASFLPLPLPKIPHLWVYCPQGRVSSREGGAQSHSGGGVRVSSRC